MNMCSLRFGRTAIGGLLFLLSLTVPAAATTGRNIGSASAVTHEVSSILEGYSRRVRAGDDVFANEKITTARASTAQLLFLDRSRLSIGPSASVILDHFIYNPDRSVRAATVQFVAGAARWIGGASESRAYEYRTPQAVIGVRGTAFDLLVERGRTIVTLRRGAIIVCLIHGQRRCVTVSETGHTVVATQSEIRGPVAGGPSLTRFATNCLSPNDTGQCAFRAYSAVRFAGPPTECPGGEGRLLNGQCVNARLASVSRQRGVLTTQLKLSETALPVPPNHDLSVPRAAQFNRFELGPQGNFSTNPFPPSP